MSLSSSVQSLLKKQLSPLENTVVTQSDSHDPRWHDEYLRSMSAAKSIILHDSDGKVQVIFPADRLLDLKAVNHHLGRELHAIAPEEASRFCKEHQLLTIPALPLFEGMQTLVDKSLLDEKEIWVDAGKGDQLLHFNQDEFSSAIGEAVVADLALPLAPLEVDDNVTSDTDYILNAVKNFTKLRIKQRLEETLELPPLSDTAQRIIKLRVNPNADISDLAQIVETDPSLAAQVVSWAASPYYSAPGKIKSIHDAIVRVLGFDMVLNLALGLSLGKQMTIPKEGPHGVLPYWQQAVYMAATIEGLVTAIPRDHRPSFGMAYLCGLLHNFGYLILAEIFQPHFRAYCDLADANPHVDHQVIERHLLGVTREQLASTLMALWSMPDEVVFGLRQQNNPEYSGEYQAYAKLIYVAQRLLAQHNLGLGPKETIPPKLFADLHLDPEKANTTVMNIIESSKDLAHIAYQLSPHR